MKYFIYSSHEALSRQEFPKYKDDPDYFCIDWMEEHDKVTEFLATGHSGPSSFPSIVDESEFPPPPLDKQIDSLLKNLADKPELDDDQYFLLKAKLERAKNMSEEGKALKLQEVKDSLGIE